MSGIPPAVGSGADLIARLRLELAVARLYLPVVKGATAREAMHVAAAVHEGCWLATHAARLFAPDEDRLAAGARIMLAKGADLIRALRALADENGYCTKPFAELDRAPNPAKSMSISDLLDAREIAAFHAYRALCYIRAAEVGLRAHPASYPLGIRQASGSARTSAGGYRRMHGAVRRALRTPSSDLAPFELARIERTLGQERMSWAPTSGDVDQDVLTALPSASNRRAGILMQGHLSASDLVNRSDAQVQLGAPEERIAAGDALATLYGKHFAAVHQLRAPLAIASLARLNARTEVYLRGALDSKI